MNGYHGKFLQVDLSTKEIKEMNLREDDLRMFIGGSTLAAKLIYDHVQPDMDPLAPKSPLIFATGPFTGTTIPMVSRSAVVVYLRLPVYGVRPPPAVSFRFG
jgi:aldehyde:ferredoxin oxidoreductase